MQRVNLTLVGVPIDRLETVESILKSLNKGLKLGVKGFEQHSSTDKKAVSKSKVNQDLDSLLSFAGKFNGVFKDMTASDLRKSRAGKL